MDELFTRLGWNLLLCIPFGILVWCLCRISRVRSRPAVCHGLWLLVLLKMTMPVFIFVPVLPAASHSTPDESKTFAEPFSDTVDLPRTFIESEQPLPSAPSVAKGTHSPERRASPTLVASNSHVASSSKISPWRTAKVTFVVVSLAVTLAVWFASLRQLRRLQRLLRDCQPPSERVTQLLDGLSPQFRLRKLPDLVVVDSPIAPVVWSGTRQAVVVLSQQLIQSLNDAQIQHVLAHELAHLERRDHWSNLFGFFVGTLFWWHPMAWLAQRERCLAAESCCDAIVLERRNGSRKSYAQTLVNVMDLVDRSKFSRPALALNFGGTSSLRKRIHVIADSALRTQVSVGGWSLLLVVAANSLLLPARAQEQKQPDRQSMNTPAETKSKPTSGAQEQDQSDARFEADKMLVTNGTVFDMAQKPISGAQVTLHRLDGELSAALETAVTDAGGHFEFPPRLEDAYYYVIIRKVPYAPIKQQVSSEAPLKSALRPAVDAWIDVRSASGEPLKGAQVANLSIRTLENTETYVRRGIERLLGYEFTESNESGRLNLPPLPEGAIIDVVIDHPQWAQTRLSNTEAAKGCIGSVTLSSGVVTTFQFVADPRTPITLDGVTCEILLFGHSSSSEETLNRVPMTIRGDRFKFCAHPATYRIAQLKAAGVAITPVFDRLALPQKAETPVRFLVRKTAAVSGRVMRRDGTPHEAAVVFARCENLSPDGNVEGAGDWTYADRATTDAEGKFVLALPPGRSRIEVDADGFLADRDYAELEVRADGPNEIPDFITDALAPIRGQVVDERGRPAPGAIVRIRSPSLVLLRPAVSDAEGRFEIALPFMPVDLETQQRRYELDVAAFVADRPLIGIAHIDLRRSDSLKNIEIALRPESSADELLGMEDNEWSLAMKRKAAAEEEERYPAGQRGQPAPELDGLAWFNTDARSLKDFRGRYVLLDFWFTGCGPCHADFPSVKLVHERLEKLGVTVIGVHDNSSSPEAVREHCKQQGLKFPIVVDYADGRIVNSYRKLGLRSFPTYMLIGPDGNILENDRTSDGPLLRVFKLEVVRRYVLHHQRK